MRGVLVVGVVLLAGCAPQIVPSDTSAVVGLYSGGPFSGSHKSELFPDDVLRMTAEGPFGADRKVATRQLAPGAFVAARDHIRRHPIAQKRLDQSGICDDYGGEIVSYRGPDAEIRMMAGCPNAQLAKLYGDVTEIIAAYDETGGAK